MGCGFPLRIRLAAVVLVWVLGNGALLQSLQPTPVVLVHWANGHMMDQDSLLPSFAREFNGADHQTADGRRIEIRPVRANSGEIAGELVARIRHEAPIDRQKIDPEIVTPAADHWVGDVNLRLGYRALGEGSVTPATTFIGIVMLREMAICLGWPTREIGFGEIVGLTTDPGGWSKYPCAKAEWGREPQLAFTYPNRSSTARSVLYALYAIAARKPVESLTIGDVTQPEVLAYVQRFQSAIDCYVPDTLELNLKLLSSAPCAQVFFLAEDNLVKLYQGKIGAGSAAGSRSLERDMVMIYPREGSIQHNHSAFLVHADYVSPNQAEAARQWVDFLRSDRQQQAFMQEGFRATSKVPCISPLGSPFSPCGNVPKIVIRSDDIDPSVAEVILKIWG